MEDEDFIEMDPDEDTYDIWFCPDSSDSAHCNHWHDGGLCCYCGSNEGRVDE